MFIAGRHTNILKPQRGDMCALSLDGLSGWHGGGLRLYLAPDMFGRLENYLDTPMHSQPPKSPNSPDKGRR